MSTFLSLPARFDPLSASRTCAFVVHLLNYHFLPQDRFAELLTDLFGLKAGSSDHRPDEHRVRRFAQPQKASQSVAVVSGDAPVTTFCCA
jgi:hypothetical protein